MEPSPGQVRLGRQTGSSGALLALAATPLAVVPISLQGTLCWTQAGAGALTACLVLASMLVVHRARVGRILATVGLVGMSVLGLGTLLREPLYALAAIVGTMCALAVLWEWMPTLPGRAKLRTRPVWAARANGAALAAAAIWLLWPSLGLEQNPAGDVAAGWALAVATALGVAWAVLSIETRRWEASVLLTSTAVSCFLSLRAGPGSEWVFVPLGLNALAVILLTRVPHRPTHQEAMWDIVLGHPERAFVGTFAALCLIGTLVLALPISSAYAEPTPLLDAVFTSTSAVCVTGLIVRDTPVDFSLFGQATILALIQLGGLGVMTFYAFALWALKRRMSLRHESAVTGTLGSARNGGAKRAVKRVLLVTFTLESVGCAALTSLFLRHGDDLGPALWRGLFTSISAFCNAGFALQSDSLIAYQESPAVLHVIAALIVLGGLSPVAIFALPALVRKTSAPVSAQARLCLVSTGVLLVGGFLFYAAFEWNASLAGLPLFDKLHNAWFQSATLRTAGFNSVGLERLGPAAVTLALAWMFIGGNPGGTAGGVKTTTVSVLALTVLQSIRGRSGIDIFGRRIAARSSTKATTIVSLGAVSCILALLAMQLTQKMTTAEAAFEVVSALGTVGLSIGGTAQLDGIGKLIIIGCMFVGRVGGLTLLMFLSTKNKQTLFRLPEEEIDVG